MHGGGSTGPRTPKGLERCREARSKHGRRSAKAVAARKSRGAEMRKIHAELRYLKFESGSEQGFDVRRVLNRLDVLSRKAEELGRFATAIRCERLIGKYCGMFAARSNHTS